MSRSANRLAAVWPALLVTVLLAVGCGGASGGILDHPALERYDNEHTADGQLHLPTGVSADYTVIPPYGEEHSPIPLTCGIYSATPAFEMVVHGMEHGAIVFWYSPNEMAAEDIARLTGIASRHLEGNDYVIQAPYGGLGAPLMLVAWGARLPMEDVDEGVIEQFFDEFHDEAPEPLAAGGCPTAR